MAEENLGTAVLRIVVNDDEARSALNLLRRDVQSTTQQATRARRTTARTTADPAEAARRRAERAAEQAANKRVSIQNRLNLLEAKGVDVTAFRLRAARANEAAQQSQFDVARSVNAQLSRALSIEENRLRVSAAQTAQLKRQEAATKSVTSTERTRAQKPTGVGFATTPEQILAGRGGTQKGAANSINTINTALDKAVQLRNRLNVLDAKGADVSKLRATYEQANAAANQSQFGTSQRLLQNLARQVSLSENDLRVANLREAAEKRRLRDAAAAERKAKAGTARTGTTSTGTTASKAASFEDRLAVARTRATRAAEKETQQRQKDTQGRIASGLIGGGFPLLFGQGGGAATGGLLGGLIGGGPFGFGASIVGTLLGSQIDLLNQRFGELATALEEPTSNFDVFIQKATLASKAQESLARALQETGQNAAAAELIQREASRTIDPISAQGAVIAQDDFNRALSNTQDVLGSIVSGPASGFLNFLTSTLELLGGTPQQGTTDPITNSLEGADKAAKKLGVNVGGILSGALLTAGGISALLTGAGAPIGVGLIGAGLSTAGIGAAGAGSALGDLRVASSQEVITAELAVSAAKERQVALEREILQARAAGKKGLEEQLSLRAQFNALAVQELQGISRIQQELARKQDGFNDLEDQADAIRQERELAAAIELRRQALLAAASAAQAASVIELKSAKELVGKYGSEREILSTQLEIKSATDAAYQAQLQLNKARKDGASSSEIEAAEKIVNTLINKRILTELEGQEKIGKIRSDNAAQRGLDEAQDKIKLQSIGRQIAATQALGNTQKGVARDTLESTQGIQAGIAAARDREREIGAQIDAARLRGGDAGEQEASRLVEQQKIAANETRLELEKGALVLTEAGEQLRDNLRNVVVDFTRVRSDAQGLNKFLNPQQQQQRAEQDFRLLLPQFREAQARFTQLTGARAPEFVGSTADVNAAIRDLIQRTQTESQATQNLADTQQAIATNTADLNKTNAALASKIQELAEKNWAVNVAVSGGQAAISGDVLNGAISP